MQIGVAYWLNRLATAAFRQGDLGAAAVACTESITLWQMLPEPEYGELASALETLALVAVEQHDFERSACLLGAAESIRESTGSRLKPFERTEPDESYEAAGRSGRDRLGDAAFESAYATGQAMTLQQAIAYAKEARARSPRAYPIHR